MINGRTIKESVLSRLMEQQIECLCHRFIQYTFEYLDITAQLLQPKITVPNVSRKEKTLAPIESLCSVKNYSQDAAQVATLTAAAIHLCQTLISLGRRIPNGSRTFSGHVTSTCPIGVCETHFERVQRHSSQQDSSRLRLDRPNALEILERCDRLRKEFGVYVEPSKIPSRQTAIDFDLHSRRDGVNLRQVDGFSQWRETCNTTGIEKARKLFWELGATQIEEAADVRMTHQQALLWRILKVHAFILFRPIAVFRLDSQAFLDSELTYQRIQRGKGHRQQHHILNPAIPPLAVHEIASASMNSSCRFTRLLQFGMLIGVGESYVRQSTIRVVAERATKFTGKPIQTSSTSASITTEWITSANAGVQCLRRLLCDIERNPSPNNALDIVGELPVSVLQSMQKYRLFSAIHLSFHMMFEQRLGPFRLLCWKISY